MKSTSRTANSAAALLVAVLGLTAWIGEILARTIGYGKVPGSHLPDWARVAFFLCGATACFLSLALLVYFAGNRREKLSRSLGLGLLIGLSPLLIVVGRFLVI